MTKTTNVEQTNGTSRVKKIREFGQQVWLDDIMVDLIDSGEFQRLIDSDGLSGLTTNPSIFEKALRTNPGYEMRIRQRSQQSKSAHDIYGELIVEDVQKVSDALRSHYDSTGGSEGYVSIEVDPDLAHDHLKTVEQATLLFHLVNRPNILIKIPGTKEGEKAIRQLVSKGINVNVTLLFSADQYERAAYAYLKGAEDYIKAGGDPSTVYSVASVFVSRIDTLVDKLLLQIIERSTSSVAAEEARALVGKAALANSKNVYSHFEKMFKKRDFDRFKEQGIKVQDIVWGSTGTKDPNYSDVKYVENLIGRHTINTMPWGTLDAFRDHGTAASTVTEGISEAKDDIKRLADIGISIENVCEKLQRDGVESFQTAFVELIAGIDEKLVVNTEVVTSNEPTY